MFHGFLVVTIPGSYVFLQGKPPIWPVPLPFSVEPAGNGMKRFPALSTLTCLAVLYCPQTEVCIFLQVLLGSLADARASGFR